MDIFSGAGLTAVSAKNVNEANIKAQKETNELNRQYGRRATAVSSHQANTAVQRKVSDMYAAGLNPMVLAGQSAQGSQVASPTSATAQAPQLKAPSFGKWGGMPLSIATSAANLQNTVAQTSNLQSNDQLIRAQGKSADAIADREILENEAMEKMSKENPALFRKAVLNSKYGSTGMFGDLLGNITDLIGNSAKSVAVPPKTNR